MTAGSLNHVWTPLRIGRTDVRHRIMMTAQTILYANEDYLLSDRHIAFYRERAKGGAALLVTEQQAVHPISKGSFYANCVAYDERAIPQYAKLAEAVHEHGARQFVQLYAAGVHDRGTMIVDEWHPLWGASRVPSIVHRELPLVMEEGQIREIVEGYARSAANVARSGLDGVEIHGAHSYLVGQFLSPTYNRRDDRYGGSVENRCRLALEAAAAIRERVGDFTLGIRLSFDEFVGENGITEDDAEEQLAVLADSGLFDYFSITGGGYHTLHYTAAPMSVEDGFMIRFGKRAKEIVGDRARVFVVGRIVDPAMADRIVADGAADMVAMTRAQMADPFLVRKAQEGRERDIVRCIGVNECVARAFEQREVTCLVNPAVGRERGWGEGTLEPAERAKRVVVVGGGPAGMKTAAVAAARGHEVILLEREPELGGHIDLVKRLPTRGKWQLAIDNLERMLERAGVDVRTGVEASPELLADERPEVVVCATGSTWDRSGFSAYRLGRDGIPGAAREHVLDVATATRRALEQPASLGERVLVVDESAGYLPVGLAEVLADAGADVEVLTPHLFVGEELLRTQEMPHLFPRVTAKGVRFTAQHFVESIGVDDVEVYELWSGTKRRLRATTVVLALTRTPDDRLFREIRSAFPEVHRVGDAVAPRKPAAVIYEGERLGREI